MKCPYCSEWFNLTWRRYFSTPLRKHGCPKCHRRSKLVCPTRIVAMQVGGSLLWAALLVGGLLLFGVKVYADSLGESWWVFPVFIIAYAIVVLPLDRWSDETYGSLKPIDN